MKKLGLLLTTAVLGLSLAACSNANKNTSTEEVKIIAPTGTPGLALANFKVENTDVSFDIATQGASELQAAFLAKSHNIIVAPINLGANVYNKTGDYVLAKTFVWGNLFLASKSELTSFDDINGKKLIVFGKDSTPDIITKILIQEKNLNVDIEYVNAVSDANPLLIKGKAEYIITAEPAISKIKDANGINVIDLQSVYGELTGTSSYPQAGIFVKKSVKKDKNIKDTVNALIESVKSTIENPEAAATNAVTIDNTFKDLGAAVLTKAIPNCHYNILDNKKDEKTAVEKYLQYMIDLGLGAQIGDKLPDEGFYL